MDEDNPAKTKGLKKNRTCSLCKRPQLPGGPAIADVDDGGSYTLFW